MTAPPMRPWQNALALTGVVFAAGALLPLRPEIRLLCAALAVATIAVLLVVRMRAHRARRDDARTSDVYRRIERIRSGRQRGRSGRPQ
jgi:hypothetical protein